MPIVTPLPAGHCLVVFTLNQSNGFGTSSWLEDAPNRRFPVAPPRCYIYDRIKRWSYDYHSVLDSKPGNPFGDHSTELAQFRAMFAGYGASCNPYSWVELTADAFGPEIGLSWELSRWYQCPVFVVKVAKGGMGVYDLGPGQYDYNVAGLDTKPESLLELARDYYWGPALWEIMNTFGYARSQIHASCISFIGAADSNNATHAAAYQANLEAIIAEVRSWISPSDPTALPWGIVRSEPYWDDEGNLTNHPYIAEVRAAQEAVAAAGTNIRWVSCDDCQREDSVTYGPGNGEHINGHGMVRLSHSMASLVLRSTPLVGPFGEVNPT